MGSTSCLLDGFLRESAIPHSLPLLPSMLFYFVSFDIPLTFILEDISILGLFSRHILNHSFLRCAPTWCPACLLRPYHTPFNYDRLKKI
jgi:hypothetical protein